MMECIKGFQDESLGGQHRLPFDTDENQNCEATRRASDNTVRGG